MIHNMVACILYFALQYLMYSLHPKQKSNIQEMSFSSDTIA